MNFNEWSTVINTIVRMIGIIVGIIGWRSLSTATNIKNNLKNVDKSIVQQAHTITVNNGLDTYAVIKLSKETTQKELEEIINRINDTNLRILSI